MAVRTLLIVDDDPALGRLVQEALPICRVLSAGAEGGVMEALRRHRPAVVALPVKDGPADGNGTAAGLSTAASLIGGVLDGVPSGAVEGATNGAVDGSAGGTGTGDGTGPDGSGGLSALTRILAEAPSTKVIALAPEGKRQLAVRAVARGAHEVCRLPLDPGEFSQVVERAFYRSELEREGRRLGPGDAPPTLRVLRDEAERRALLDAMARSGGNLSATARMLGVSRPTLYSLLRQHGVRAE
ncbi:helix-turn-helix domain-containing protein [Azospirillum sp. SYSU D00513]|uniref:helix-turn-helix domain-containing protein n=1 Tax=Azospirillum sp. SYSU D00513 TaxID=2812561 RepID=UPI001FFFB435|nr:helix-turn-helix domain-containing protein [Azospirillum sp. SYSU D00513]